MTGLGRRAGDSCCISSASDNHLFTSELLEVSVGSRKQILRFSLLDDLATFQDNDVIHVNDGTVLI
jgi:hypothetical protein